MLVLKGCGTMEPSLYELVQKILWGVSFIAIGGVMVVMFFLLFAQSIIGSKTMCTQLEKLLRQSEDISRQLKQIAQHLQKEQEKPPKKS
jgi:hypothetical protein